VSKPVFPPLKKIFFVYLFNLVTLYSVERLRAITHCKLEIKMVTLKMLSAAFEVNKKLLLSINVSPQVATENSAVPEVRRRH